MNDDTPVTLTMSVKDCNLVLTALGELPLKLSGELWSRLKRDAEAQLAPPPPPPMPPSSSEPEAAGLTD